MFLHQYYMDCHHRMCKFEKCICLLFHCKRQSFPSIYICYLLDHNRNRTSYVYRFPELHTCISHPYESRFRRHTTRCQGLRRHHQNTEMFLQNMTQPILSICTHVGSGCNMSPIAFHHSFRGPHTYKSLADMFLLVCYKDQSHCMCIQD